MKQTGRSQEEIVEQVHELLEERGGKALEMAKKEMLREKIEARKAFWRLEAKKRLGMHAYN